MTSDDVLSFWFGDPSESPQVRSKLWFEGSPEIDAEVRERFGDTVQQALAGQLDDWTATLPGAMALLVVLDQLTRHVHRGTVEMFSGDPAAQRIATSLLAHEQALPVAHRAAVYLALTHTEDVAVVADADARMHALVRDEVSRGMRRPLKGMRTASKRHLRTLNRFGRYPHRNELLGRENTDAEVAWLANARYRFVRSVRPHAPTRLKILVLHSFRQSGTRLRSRMRALERHLEDIAELVFVDAPHPYQPDAHETEMLEDDFGAVPDFRHQRCWWNADDEGQYLGADDSLRALADRLPVDGVLGFSQGGAMAGLLAAMHASQLRFVIQISGFPARSETHAAFMAPAAIDLPSLHIYGEQDVLVDVDRTQALAACFVDPEVVSHPGGHFFPDSWPQDVVRQFLLPFLPQRPPRAQLDEATLQQAQTLDDARRLVARASDLRALLDEAKGRRVPPNTRRPPEPDAPAPSDPADRLWCAAFEASPEAVREALSRDDDFVGLTRLAVRAATDLPDASELLDALADRFADQIRRDGDLRVVSSAGRAAPRRRSRTEELTGLGQRIAQRLEPDVSDEARAIRYRKRIADLAKRHRAQHRRAHRQPSRRPSSSDIPAEVSRPRPVPVIPAPHNELAPLLAFLSQGTTTVQPAAFPRGTVMPDGRLDLCKQVVGPQGIGPLLDALKGHPQVHRLLLGNNVVGRAGAERIARFIRSGQSNVRVWYIAGNELDGSDVALVCDALASAPDVEGLWLKRNPLGPPGGAAVATLLRANTPLLTLDLVNTGLLDEGANTVIGALEANHHLRHLYLGTNGLSAAVAGRLAAYLDGANRLESLFLDCNRLGDSGVVRLAEGLAASRGLRRLSLASNRIGPEGARALAAALRDHPSLVALNLGWTRATAAVHERGNELGDEGAQAIAELLASNHTLRVLDVSHNDISQRGLDHLREALEANQTLVSLRCPQRGKATNPDRMARLRGLVLRNREAAGIDEAGIDAIRTPAPTHEILSVYRTKPMAG